jgi:hypothetical protein
MLYSKRIITLIYPNWSDQSVQRAEPCATKDEGISMLITSIPPILQYTPHKNPIFSHHFKTF